MARSQFGKFIYGLITMTHLQLIAHFYIFGALGTISQIISKSPFRITFLSLLLLNKLSPAMAQSGDTKIALIVTETLNAPSSVNQQVSGSVIPNSLNQQVSGSVIQYNGSDYSSGLNNQNCYGGCAYLNIKSYPSVNNVEISVGGLWQFNSPEQDRREIVRISTEPARKDAEIRQQRSDEEIINTLRRELTESLASNKIASAVLIAKQLAPKLKYQNHWQLLEELGWSKANIDLALKSQREQILPVSPKK